MAKLLCAVAARDEVASGHLLTQAGFLTTRRDPWILSRTAMLHWGEYSEYSLGRPGDGKLGGVVKAQENLEILDPITQFYEAEGDVFIAARGGICMRLTATTFGLFEVNTAVQVQPFAEEFLRSRRIDPGIVPGRTLPADAEPDFSRFPLHL